MIRTMSIRKFRKEPLHALEACQGRPLAITSGGQVVFYCVPAELYSQLSEAVRMTSLEEKARSRSRDMEQLQDMTGKNAGLIRDPSMQASHKPISFHPHAYEEWCFLPKEKQREVTEMLDGSLNTERFEPFACLNLSGRSVRLLYENHLKAIVVWAISNRLPLVQDVPIGDAPGA